MALNQTTSPLRKRFAANTGWLIAQSVFQYVLSAVIGIIAARFLGPTNFGILGYGASLMAFFTSVASLGFYDIQITNMVESPEDTGGIIGTALTLRLASSTLSILGIAVVVMIARPGDKLLLIVTVLQSLQLIFQAFDAVRQWFQMKLLSKFTAIGSIVGNIACSIWRIVLLIKGASVEWFALTSAIQMLTNYLLVVPLFFVKSKTKLWFSFGIAKRLFHRSWHYILAGLTQAVTAHFGRLVLSGSMGDASLGYYNAAYYIATMWLFVPLAIIDSSLPVLLETKRDNPDAFRPRYQLMLMAVLGIGVAAGIGLCTLAPWIVNLLYGASYAPAANVLRVVAWIGIFSNIGSARGIFVQAEGQQSAIKYISFLVAASSIALSMILIPIYRLMGAAVSCLLGFIVESMIATAIIPGTRPYLSLYAGSFKTLFHFFRNMIRNRKFKKEE